MFQAIFRRAQAAVESSIDQAVNRAVMMVPFLVAAGFGTAALAYRLNREFGPEVGNLFMAVIFGVVGMIVVAVMTSKPRAIEGEEESLADSGEVAREDQSAETQSEGVSDVDRELITSAITNLAPAALPQILRLAVKNLPLIAVLASAVFVASRANGADDSPQAAPQPAT